MKLSLQVFTAPKDKALPCVAVVPLGPGRTSSASERMQRDSQHEHHVDVGLCDLLT